MRFPLVRPRQPLAGVALAAVLGIVIADAVELDSRWLFGIAAGVAGALAWRARTWLCWICVALTFAGWHTQHHREHPARQIASAFPQPRAALITGVVSSEPVASQTSRTPSCRFFIETETLEIGGTRLPAEFRALVRWAGAAPAYGDRVNIHGSVAPIAPSRNPGEFNYAAYLARQGTFLEITARYATDCRILGQGHGNPAIALGISLRHWMKGCLALDLQDSPEISDLIASMVLGMRGETPDEVQELFQHTGTLHLFAVSGLNVTMLALIAWALLKPLRVPRVAAVYVTIPIVVAYATVTGLSASCVRATIMGGLMLAAFVIDRPVVLYNSVAAAAVGILAWDTHQLFSPGFQFSFALVLTLIFLAARLQKRVEPLGMPDPFLPRSLWTWRQRGGVYLWKKGAEALSVTCASWLGSLALTAGYFHLFSPNAILANLVAVPIAFGMLVLGILSVTFAAVGTPLAVLFNNANWACAKLLIECVRFFDAIPGGYAYVELPSVHRTPACEIQVLDLAEGGAIHLRFGGHDWLIDPGPRSGYKYTVLPYLRSRGVNCLSGLVLTHGDAQHIGAATDVWEDLRPAVIGDSALKDRSTTRKRFLLALAAKNTPKRILRTGDVLRVAPGAQIEVLYPPSGLARSIADDKALVLRVVTSGVRVLMMSDSGFSTEQWLLENEPDLRADILIKGWSARDLSGTDAFLSRVRPRVMICGTPVHSASAATMEQWVEGVRRRGIALFRQEQTGAVRLAIEADGTANVSGFLSNQSLRLPPPSNLRQPSNLQ